MKHKGMGKGGLKDHKAYNTKIAGETPVKGGNLKLPKPSQAIHVMPEKDQMAGNVGGSAAHQGRKDQFGPGVPIMKSSGAGIKKEKDKY